MNNDIIHKVRQLLKLAEKTTFPAEAANATAKAQSLMDKYKITLGALETSDKEKPQFFKDSPLNEGETGKQLARWKWSLASVLNSHNGVWAYQSGSQIICVGTPSNVSAVRYLYSYCSNQIESLTAQNCKGQGRIYANNFRLGCIDAIRDALRAERTQTFEQARSEALAIVDRVESGRQLAVINNAIALMQNEEREAASFAKSQMRFSTGSVTGVRSLEYSGTMPTQ